MHLDALKNKPKVFSHVYIRNWSHLYNLYNTYFVVCVEFVHTSCCVTHVHFPQACILSASRFKHKRPCVMNIFYSVTNCIIAVCMQMPLFPFT